MTKMNRLSITLLTIRLKERKKIGAMVEPHVLSGMQSGGNLIVSYMILFQSSPVDMEKSKEKLMWKLVKFLCSLITFPSYTSANIVLPSTAMMKKINIKRMNTLTSESIDIIIVFNSFCRSLYCPARRRTRLTLNTRKTLASYGPTDRI